jgi:hypothetical protein
MHNNLLFIIFYHLYCSLKLVRNHVSQVIFPQGASLVMIFFSSHFQEAAIAIIVIILLAYNFPAAWTSKLLAYW